MRVALIGSYPPRHCGIATFTCDIVESLGQFATSVECDVYATDDPAWGLTYQGIAGRIDRNRRDAYFATARQINESRVDAVWLQHEFGIFGGDDGEYVVDLVRAVAAPFYVTLHTVLSAPSARQRAIVCALADRASGVMVMSRHSRDLLIQNYRLDPDRIQVIEHGAPDRPFGRSDAFKAALGLAGRPVLMTFGLLGPGKGLELAIDALPAILAAHPETIYRIVGATHPNLIADEGEAYREGLIAQAVALGVHHAIQWDNRYLDTEALLDQLEACDIYLTPYRNLEQATSGTLSYAVALGKAVLSTPYHHARELLADGVGVLIEPGSAADIAKKTIALLGDRQRLGAMQQRAWARGRNTIWPCFAERVGAFLRAGLAPAAHPEEPNVAPSPAAVLRMTDDTGMLQHSIGEVPDRNHGYCIDDNARALMLANIAPLLPAERARLQRIYAAFVQHGWNDETRRFRNFMSYGRSWLEDAGSEDSNGRAIWALGHTIAHATDAGMRDWAQRLLNHAAPHLAALTAPRAMSFYMLGLCAALRRGARVHMGHRHVADMASVLAGLLERSRRPDWVWFEAVLGYDNPRLPQALIEAGVLLERPDWVASGGEALAWIAELQTAHEGHFRPIGSEAMGGAMALPFDQQPLEAAAAIDAAAAAWRARPAQYWLDHARRAYAWFGGDNDRGLALAEAGTGLCRDGLQPAGINANCGAESILSFHLGHHALAALEREATRHSHRPTDDIRAVG